MGLHVDGIINDTTLVIYQGEGGSASKDKKSGQSVKGATGRAKMIWLRENDFGELLEDLLPSSKERRLVRPEIPFGGGAVHLNYRLILWVDVQVTQKNKGGGLWIFTNKLNVSGDGHLNAGHCSCRDAKIVPIMDYDRLRTSRIPKSGPNKSTPNNVFQEIIYLSVLQEPKGKKRPSHLLKTKIPSSQKSNSARVFFNLPPIIPRVGGEEDMRLQQPSALQGK